MARRENGVLKILFTNFINSLKPRSSRSTLVGSDYLGNKYYEQEADRKNRRWFLPPGGEPNFDQEMPAEWEAWLRGRRAQPPSEEEVNNNLQLMLAKKKNAQEIKAKFPPGPTADPQNKPFPTYDDYEVYPGKKPD